MAPFANGPFRDGGGGLRLTCRFDQHIELGKAVSRDICHHHRRGRHAAVPDRIPHALLVFVADHRDVDFFDVPSLVKQRRAKIANPDQRHADLRQTFIPEKTVIIHRNRPIARIRINMTTFS